jgi:hypothetical protein
VEGFEPVFIRNWTTQGIVTRIRHEQLVIIWSLYRKVGIVFRKLFVYTVLYFVRFYVCKSFYVVEVNSELNISQTVCENG